MKDEVRIEAAEAAMLDVRGLMFDVKHKRKELEKAARI